MLLLMYFSKVQVSIMKMLISHKEKLDKQPQQMSCKGHSILYFDPLDDNEKALLEKAREKERSGSENREKKEGKIEEMK